MRTLYPPIEPYNQGMLPVTDGHTLYYEESGNPNGKPIVFLHGGPGSGTSPKQRQFFDPEAYRIILFDQRGSGKSTPHASLEHNTTWDLVADIERLREHLGIDRWVVFGGSWGSTLALAYGQTHPDRTKALVLRGIFMCRDSEINWFYQSGIDQIFADAWEDFIAVVPEDKRNQMVTTYYDLLRSEDEDLRLRAAQAWSTFEATCCTLLPDPANVTSFAEAHHALSIARIECHYFINKAFFDTDDHLLRNVDKIRHIPAVIVQGRYDVVCPMTSAWALHKAWPEADFRLVPDAGHLAFEPGIASELVAACDRFREL
ncbi:MAG: prolyl aminopeptidase [Blastocatellia bacterium]|nr:prolyl aminopeptidase [Blastocatellia bacterium]